MRGTTHTAKGRTLWQETSYFGFSLVSDPAFPTRRGTSTTRDSVTDLTFVKNVDLVKWSNLMVDLGSDHYITTTSFEVSQKKLRAFSTTDWDRFRKIRQERAAHGEKPGSLQQWTESVMQDVRESTKMIQQAGTQANRLEALAEIDINLHTKSGDTIPCVALIRILGVDPLATQSAGEDEIVDSVWVAASLKADGYEVIADADGSLSSLLGSSSETCLAGGSRTSSGTTSTDNGE
ncbi:hypothetical protein MTO96_003604 [Rhipicephalus appendiculatus]